MTPYLPPPSTVTPRSPEVGFLSHAKSLSELVVQFLVFKTSVGDLTQFFGTPDKTQ